MIFVGLVIGLFILDWIIKYFVEKKWNVGEEKKIGNDKLILRKLHNKGAALNLLESNRKELMILNILLMSGLSIFFIKVLLTSKNVLEKISVSMLLAGGLNNLWDRIKRGYVVDYFSFNSRFKKLKSIVFNISDFFIFIGAILLLISSYKKGK